MIGQRLFIAALAVSVLTGCNRAESSMQRGNMAYRAGRVPEAIQYYQQALASDETKAAASYNLGRVSLESGDAERAKEYLDQALELELEHPMVRVYRARALLALGNEEEARRDLERVTKSHPDSLQGFLELAKLQFAQGEFAAASESAQAARKSRTLTEEATLLSAASKREIGDLDGAISELEVLVASHGFRIPTHFTLADYLLEAHDYREAERRYRGGLEMDPTNSEALFGLAEALQGQGKQEEALRVCEVLISSGSADNPVVQEAKDLKAKIQSGS